MSVRVTSNPAEFQATVFPFLQDDPVLHSTLLSNTEDRVNGILHDPLPALFVSIHDERDRVIGAVLCSAYRGIQLGALAVELVPEIVDACTEAPNQDTVVGTPIAARRLAELLAARNGTAYREATGIRLHKLAEFVEQHADGFARRAVAADVELVVTMMDGFGAELGRALPAGQQERWVRSRIDRGRVWVWERAGQVVSLVGHQQTLFGATRVGPVYTPPAERGHGYASALTAHVTRQLQEAGSQVCLLTDLANPTSNKIYAAIGFRPLTDFMLYELDPAMRSGDLD
ncbi:GNAT family N-acetyltransferase [Kribbella sp. CA-293567]|uniref:GNAT family N-acetyltransferase n=1 Tax=Kribbella sp. CA-293567 TaxID=3002436 RepID=UPI0022DE4ADB|nr:GNAT family N-acetyltransferase [Kribbella sp. CA-293567]WBQ06231.1 GNAT family N-acetyltransferase [Kribbella sp. CA-293567]